MDKETLRQLRIQQRIYSNVLLVLCLGLVVGIILLAPATRGDVYEMLGVSLLASIVGQLMLYKMKPKLLFARFVTQQLNRWEKEKLGESWLKYTLPGMILRGILTIYFFLQARLYAGKTLFRSEVPYWYFIVIPLIFILITNVHMTLHARRIDTRTQEELKSYCQEKMLFTKIFAIVASAMTLIGFALVFWLR